MVEHQKVVWQANSFKTLVQKTRQPHHTNLLEPLWDNKGFVRFLTSKILQTSARRRNSTASCNLRLAMPRKSQWNCVNQDCKHKPEATITMRSAPMSSILHLMMVVMWWGGDVVMWWWVMWWCGDVWCMWWFYDGGDGGDVVLDFLHCHIFRITEEFRL